MTLQYFKHLEATTLDEAVAISDTYKEKATLIAGGTDLLSMLKDNTAPTYPELVVDIKTIPDLAYLREDGRNLRIGPLTTIHEIETNETIRQKYGLLAEAARSVASPQIRNMGTVGGNICQLPRCWYFRYPENFFDCLRKGGKKCNAMVGENQYHSIFGGVRIDAPPCSSECPPQIDIPSYLSRIRDGKLAEAAKILLDYNPMPAITGRVCPHFCERMCNRNEFDESVSVRGVERFVGDYILENPGEVTKASTKNTGKSVAIVGSGPAGLSAAYYLRKAGHQVTVFDRAPEPGGMLTYGIPAFRLPKDLVRRQVAILQGMGMEFKLKVHVGSDVALESLNREFNSLFLASGAWRQRALGIEKEELLMSGLDFLSNVRLGLRKPPGKRILVIGGGNVAVDVATTAQRLGSEHVTMACLEPSEEMPAIPEDVEKAIDEGIIIMPSWGPYKILETAGRISGMELARCTSVFDDKGHFRPTLDPNVRETVEADQVILAIGQVPDLSYTDRSLMIDRGLIVVDKDTQATNIPGIFAGGDSTAGTASVIEAIAAGRRAAASINSYLGGAIEEARSKRPRLLLDFNGDRLGKTQRARFSELAPSERSIDVEDSPGFDLDLADMEANRCLNCGCLAVNSSDLAPALVALDARIKTTKRTLGAEEFFDARPVRSTVLDLDELVTGIEVPTPAPATRQTYLKFRIRNSIDFPIVSVAAAISMDGDTVADARIVLGAVAPVPLRAREVEDFLRGKVPTEEIAEAAAAVAVKGANPLSKNKYKIQVAKALVKKAILRPQAPPRSIQAILTIRPSEP
jgi:NADPH-dependent glutamate synthase beta subunit-like oxidoreductase/CO/xanthine dehydrogenase FAD-binding subunit